MTFPATQVISDQSHGEDVSFHSRRDGGSPNTRFRLRSVDRSSSCEMTEKGIEMRKKKRRGGRRGKGKMVISIILVVEVLPGNFGKNRV